MFRVSSCVECGIVIRVPTTPENLLIAQNNGLIQNNALIVETNHNNWVLCKKKENIQK